MNRRLFIGALGASAVGTVAGCLSAGDSRTISATPARVSADAAATAGYEYQGTRERVETERVGSEDVEVTSYVSVYDRAMELPTAEFGEDAVKAGVFAVLAAPQVTVGDETINPISDRSRRELANRIQRHYDGFEIDRAVGGRAIQALGQRFSFQSYEGTAALQGEAEIAVRLDIAQRQHEDDYDVIAAIYPVEDLLEGGSEQERIDTLVRGLEQYDDIEVEIVESGSDGGD
ncbi:DUF6517 family protein [Natrinema marinum]|uniref:DUF6517 family protein n=1 Tax=Natrinema marinum TaxID=2961598 RepID=UPI0020C89F5D|nr:DUF6517 family protein [Natrinema marinum]